MSNLKTLIIGVDQYLQNYRRLEAVNNDVELLEDLFKNYFKNNPEIIKGSSAKYSNIGVATKNFFLNSSSEDKLVLYWAGHGQATQDEGYLLAYDSIEEYTSSKISMSDICEWIDKSKSQTILVILDCCNSGIMTRNDKNTFLDLNKKLTINGKGRIIIASTNEQEAYEDDNNGIFTSIFIENLKAIIELGENKIDIMQLYYLTANDMKYAKYKQTPCLKASIEGSFILEISDEVLKIRGIVNKSLSSKKINHLSHLKDLITNSDYFDSSHKYEQLLPYLDKVYKLGKISNIKKISSNKYKLEFEWYPDARYIQTICNNSYRYIELDDAVARKFFNIIKEDSLYVTTKFSYINEKLIINYLMAEYNLQTYEIKGIHSLHPFWTLPIIEGNKFIWAKFVDNDLFLTIDDALIIRKWSINNENYQKINKIEIEENYEDIDFYYNISIHSILIQVIYESYQKIYIYNISNSKLELLHKVKLSYSVYFCKYNNSFVLYNKEKVQIYNYLSNKIKNYDLSIPFFEFLHIRSIKPIIKDIEGKLLIIAFNKFYVFNFENENIHSFKIKIKNIIEIIDENNVVIVDNSYGSNISIYNLDTEDNLPITYLDKKTSFLLSNVSDKDFTSSSLKKLDAEIHLINIVNIDLKDTKNIDNICIENKNSIETVEINLEKTNVLVLDDCNNILVWK